MSFDWIAFLRGEGIQYVTEGRNVKRGHVNIKCPWCGSADQSEHMGLDLEHGWFACWRDPRHRGKKPERLIARLKQCSMAEARRIAGADEPPPPESLDAVRQKLEQKTPTPARPATIEWPQEVKPLRDTASGGRFITYLRSRGIQMPKRAAKHYDLHYALVGKFKFRLIFPLEREGKLVGFTGRTLAESRARYLSYPSGDALKHAVFNETHAAEGGTDLILAEGPIDALKVDWHSPEGVHAIALLSTSISSGRINRIAHLSSQYDRVWACFDAEATSQMLNASSRLSVLRVRPLTLPSGVDDPGDIPAKQVRQWLGNRGIPRR